MVECPIYVILISIKIEVVVEHIRYLHKIQITVFLKLFPRLFLRFELSYFFELILYRTFRYEYKYINVTNI